MKCCIDKNFSSCPAPFFKDFEHISIYKVQQYTLSQISVKTDKEKSVHAPCVVLTTECTINCSGSAHATSAIQAGQLAL